MSEKSLLVKSGLDILVAENMQSLKKVKVGLLGHPASVDRNCVHLLTHCLRNDINVRRIFGPEHGFLGNAQDMEAVTESIDSKTRLPVISLYGASKDSLTINPNNLEDLDVLVCDLQDIGSRYYTFAYTIAFALKSCQKAGIKCMILDRPNPINGITVEGNEVLPAFNSFVGEYPLCNRHGMTMGELAHLFCDLENLKAKPEVVWMQNWQRKYFFADTSLPWVFPSPNMPTATTALVYPGGCLFEGTNLSEGRGTTKPFELVGAPYIKDPEKLTKLLEKQKLPGVIFRPCWFTPQFQKHAHKLCGGLQIHITDKNTFNSLQAAIAILWAARQSKGFTWRTEAYEFVADKLAVDLLFGTDEPRLKLEKNASVQDIMATFQKSQEHFKKVRKTVLHPDYK